MAAPRAFAQWKPSDRYAYPAVQVIDPSFARYRVVNAPVQRLSTGHLWNEGPVWFGAAAA